MCVQSLFGLSRSEKPQNIKNGTKNKFLTRSTQFYGDYQLNLWLYSLDSTAN